MTDEGIKGVLIMDKDERPGGLVCSDITKPQAEPAKELVRAWNRLQSLDDASVWRKRQPVQVSLHCRKADDPRRRTWSKPVMKQ